VPRQILGLCDSDSFVKWGATLLDTLSPDWQIELVVVATALTASPRQIRDAVSGTRFANDTPAAMSITDALTEQRLDGVDAVFVCCRGPIAELILVELSARGARRPVLVSGLPGISIPAKWRGIAHRSQADLFVLHSKREIADYRQLAAERGIHVDFGLASLPFAQPRADAELSSRDSVIFAAQAIVPRPPADRQKIARILCATAEAHPELRVVLKVRALAGESQTHAEEHPLESFLPHDAPANLVVEAGPMHEHLARARGFASISSTAVMEALAVGVPSLLLRDFGVSRELINEVFVDSDLLADGDDLVGLRFPSVNDGWRDANYFHDTADNTLSTRLGELLAARDRGVLQARPALRRKRGGALRRAWDRRLALGSHDDSALGKVAWLVGTPISTVRRLRRTLLMGREAA
jgi:hypothetical protein